MADDDGGSLGHDLLRGRFGLIGIAGVIDDAIAELLPEQAALGVDIADGAFDAARVIDAVRRLRAGHRSGDGHNLVRPNRASHRHCAAPYEEERDGVGTAKAQKISGKALTVHCDPSRSEPKDEGGHAKQHDIAESGGKAQRTFCGIMTSWSAIAEP